MNSALFDVSDYSIYATEIECHRLLETSATLLFPRMDAASLCLWFLLAPIHFVTHLLVESRS
jgi:hypothetical protein